MEDPEHFLKNVEGHIKDDEDREKILSTVEEMQNNIKTTSNLKVPNRKQSGSVSPKSPVSPRKKASAKEVKSQASSFSSKLN